MGMCLFCLRELDHKILSVCLWSLLAGCHELQFVKHLVKRSCQQDSLGMRADCKLRTLGTDEDHTQLHFAIVLDLFKEHEMRGGRQVVAHKLQLLFQ